MAQGRRIRARTCYQANGELDFTKYVLRAEHTKRVSGGKDNLEIGAPLFQRGQKLRYIGAEQIAAAFHH